MSDRAAKFAIANFASILAGTTVTPIFIPILRITADAAEACQTEPGSQTPQGKHWRYRIEHPGNRQCWYLRDVGGKPVEAGLPQPSEQATEPKAEPPPPQRSLSSAHAELPWPQTRVEQNTTTSGPQPPQAMPTNAPNEQGPNVLESTTRGSLIGTRWPDPSSATSTLNPQPATSDTVADAQADQQATTPAAAAPPAVPVAADASPAKPAASLQTLLMVVAGALALAGLIASAIFRFGSARRPARNAARGRRRVVWETADGAHQSTADGARQSPPPPPRPAPLRQAPPRQSPPRQSPPLGDPDQFKRRPEPAAGFHAASKQDERLDRISEMLARMS